MVGISDVMQKKMTHHDNSRISLRVLFNNTSMNSRVRLDRDAPMTLFKPCSTSDCDKLINELLF